MLFMNVQLLRLIYEQHSLCLEDRTARTRATFQLISLMPPAVQRIASQSGLGPCEIAE